jgi:ABC-type cobalamin/Fe3+-siderophores transport system ATPase subunit
MQENSCSISQLNLGAIKRGSQIVIAGEGACGKTALALSLIDHLAIPGDDVLVCGANAYEVLWYKEGYVTRTNDVDIENWAEWGPDKQGLVVLEALATGGIPACSAACTQVPQHASWFCHHGKLPHPRGPNAQSRPHFCVFG